MSASPLQTQNTQGSSSPRPASQGRGWWRLGCLAGWRRTLVGCSAAEEEHPISQQRPALLSVPCGYRRHPHCTLQRINNAKVRWRSFCLCLCLACQSISHSVCSGSKSISPDFLISCVMSGWPTVQNTKRFNWQSCKTKSHFLRSRKQQIFIFLG